LLFGSYEKNRLTGSSNLSQKWQCLVETFNGLRQVNDVAILTLAVNVWRHLWVPTARFVTKVDTSFEQLFNINLNGHDITPFYFPACA
jgi:hypothetical protein